MYICIYIHTYCLIHMQITLYMYIHITYNNSRVCLYTSRVCLYTSRVCLYTSRVCLYTSRVCLCWCTTQRVTTHCFTTHSELPLTTLLHGEFSLLYCMHYKSARLPLWQPSVSLLHGELPLTALQCLYYAASYHSLLYCMHYVTAYKSARLPLWQPSVSLLHGEARGRVRYLNPKP